ncbi:MAG: hypothetical protein ABI026_00165 [Gemmatimonadaceae bacterium]
MRHILQLSGPANALVALCDDETIWSFVATTASWTQLPAIPGQIGTTEADDAVALHDRAAVEQQERALQARRDRFQGKK